MTDELRDIADFLETFASDEHAARVAMYTEPDDDRYRELEERAAGHLESVPGSIMTLGFGRGSGDAAKALLDRPQDAGGFSKRVVYLVSKHDSTSGPAFRALVSDPTDAEGRYLADALHVRLRDGGPRIVGRAVMSPFDSDDAAEWEPLGGDQLEDAGPPSEVAKLRRPLDPAHAAVYDQMGAEA
jgi:hypothetical protein